MDNKGNFTLEIIVLMMFIILIIGIITLSSENSSEKLTGSIEKQNLENILIESVDNLINNPGEPENWYNYGIGTPGLAIINEGGEVIPNSISYEKFMALANDYENTVSKNIFNSKFKTSMELIPESSISSVKIGCENPGDVVYSVNRLVKCDFYKKYVIKDFQSDGKCNHNHKQTSHSCQYFKVFKSNLRDNDYYLVVDESELFKLNYYTDSTRFKFEFWHPIEKNIVFINDEIEFGEGDTSEIAFIHLNKENPKAVLVCVPKNFDKNKLNYDYFTTNNCNLIVKGWY